MMYIATFTASITVAVLALFLPKAQSSPYVINDNRVRSLDITPVLGRGYSIMTNTYQSTCLMVDETTVPSYNYDYSYLDFTGSQDIELDIAEKISYSFGYQWLKQTVISDQKKSSTSDGSVTQYIVATMRIERYYASLKEDASPLSADALTLLNNQDYIGFFKSCGPTYIRGIRRAQEVSSFLMFKSSDPEKASQFASNIQGAGWKKNDPALSAESSSLSIVIKGWGLGLTQDGSETLMARTITEFNKVMKFAFTTMTSSADSVHIGMVYGMEVAPWVESTQFQITVGVGDEDITIPLPFSLIPQAIKIDGTDGEFDGNRDDFRCKEPSFEMDRYGFCCAITQLYDTDNEAYDTTSPETRMCRPLRQLERTMIKDNLIANGEFVQRLDSAVRYRMVFLSTLERCISAARAIPGRYDAYILASQDSVAGTGGVEPSFTVWEMKMTLDPFNDFSIVGQAANELDEFMDMFYQPCLTALFGANIGLSPDEDPKYLMAYPWHSHDECSKLSCLGLGMRWDRREGFDGGCVPGILNGVGSTPYDWNDGQCSKATDLLGNEVCKYDSETLWSVQFKTTTCWAATIGSGSVMYYMDNYCMPSVTDSFISVADLDYLKANKATHCDANPNSNAPSDIPTQNPSDIFSAEPTSKPSDIPTKAPTASPTSAPSDEPSLIPSLAPSLQPSLQPSESPSLQPSLQPSESPSLQPSLQPSSPPSLSMTPSLEPSDE